MTTENSEIILFQEKLVYGEHFRDVMNVVCADQVPSTAGDVVTKPVT